MNQKISDFIRARANSIFGESINENLIQLSPTKKELKGDITLVLFPFAKILKSTPQSVGLQLGEILSAEFPEIDSFAVVNGFLNLTMHNSYWIDQLNGISSLSQYGRANKGSKPTIMVEYSSPNTNKPLHLGHLRNIFLGHSVSRILEFAGHRVVKTQVVNDRGIHICKSMVAWEKYSPINSLGERETPKNTGFKGDKLVGKYYVEFDRHLNSEVKTILSNWDNGQFEMDHQEIKHKFLELSHAKVDKDEKARLAIDDKIKDLAISQSSLMREAKEMLIKWEARDPQTYLLWTTMNGWVYEGFDFTYKRMGVEFDQLYYESDTFLLGKDQVLKGLESGVFFKKEDDSVWIDLTDEGLDEKLVLRSDGTAVYMTQDIGTAIERFEDYPDLSGIVYTVGNEQDYHFKVLFLILDKLGFSWAKNCYHLSYGMVDLPSGKMKSREGTVVDADDLMEEVVDKAIKMTKERGHLDGLDEKEKVNLYEQIGLGGLKYYLIKVDPKKRMLFNPEESIELNGNTGPFLQYTHARICSLLKKAEPNRQKVQFEGIDLLEEEKEVIKNLIQFPAIVQEAAASYSPALLANYTYELVKSFNHFYQAVKILSEENVKTKEMRLMMAESVGSVLKDALYLMGIHAPSRM
ncbi:MAG: arginine--tRNA ligase [Bacteroidetes bacterium]|nr:arginine--tRNA ligase [Bacteroidota bacterium]